MSGYTEISYRPDSAARFAPLSGRPWAVFLDSTHALAGHPLGRYDILAADPYLTLTARGGLTAIRDRSGVLYSTEDPLRILRRSLAGADAPLPGIPFCGGAIGWLAYDLARRIESLPVRARDDLRMPDLVMGLYDWALVVDHQIRRAWLVSAGRDPETSRRWDALVRLFERPPSPAPLAHAADAAPFESLHALRANFERDAYLRAIARIQSYLIAGDCYQVNLAQRFTTRVRGDAWASYLRLRRMNPAPFSAYLTTPWAQILSCSPERFLRLHDGLVETRPIKGTRPRDPSPAIDAALAHSLLTSAKDRAENLMIVDLLRNDLGKVCRTGTIEVPELFAIERFASVHHLVSTVRGRLAEGEDATGLLRACFPGGSITGAPKIRAMQIIEELEPDRRGLYCGAIGYIGFDGAMDTNIAIRTLVATHGRVDFWAGGGIVHESVAEDEYQETLDKAAPFFRLLS